LTAKGEATRRWVHLLFGSVAFLLPYCDWRLSFIGALCALFVNSEILSRAAATKHMFRKDEGWLGGIVLYPLTVALLILIYRENTLPVACAWLALAAGDPAAAFWGRRGATKRLPWNQAKSFAGTRAFFLAALIPLVVACLQHDVAWGATILIAALAAIVGALVESWRWTIADNLAVGLSVSFAVAMMRVIL
jgi:dolichol kinase